MNFTWMICNMKNKEYTDICDMNGELIPYGVPLDFTWWAFNGYSEVELHYVAKIRKKEIRRHL